MRASILFAVVITSFFVTSCTSTTVDGVHVSAFLAPVRVADVRAVMAASSPRDPFGGAGIGEIQVISSTEMHVYLKPVTDSMSFEIVRKINGKWESQGGLMVLKEQW